MKSQIPYGADQSTCACHLIEASGETYLVIEQTMRGHTVITNAMDEIVAKACAELSFDQNKVRIIEWYPSDKLEPEIEPLLELRDVTRSSAKSEKVTYIGKLPDEEEKMLLQALRDGENR